MKRSLLILLSCIVVAGWLGTLVARDPGYVLVTYDGYSMQTSLWVLIGLFVVSVVSLYFINKLVRLFLIGPGAVMNWRNNRKLARANRLTHQGLALLATGEYARAEKYLLSGAGDLQNPGTNYLAAARAADAQEKYEHREALLRQAVDADRSLGDAVSISGAEMAAARGDWQRCLTSLQPVKPTPLVLRLKQHALLQLRDWQGLADLMPLLRKTGTDLIEFEKQVAMARLSASGSTDDALAVIYKKLTDHVRRDQDIVLCYTRSIQKEQTAEAVLRQAIKREWRGRLVLAYARLGTETLQRRIKQALNWAKKRQDADLYLAVALMYHLNDDAVNAREYCQKSLDLSEGTDAHELMGTLLAEDGDYAASNDFLKRALVRGSVASLPVQR